MTDSLADPRHTAALARPLARFELLLNAAVGFAWGPLLFHFVRYVADWTRPILLVATITLTLGLGLAGAAAPPGCFRLRAWERSGSGRIYARYFRIRAFKAWMSHGDRMNAWLRRRIAGYRVVRSTRAAAAAYAARTIGIERAHLAWGLGALGPLVYALAARAYGFAALLALANAVTNGWPILLQRYNRVRAERAAGRAHRPNVPGTPNWP